MKLVEDSFDYKMERTIQPGDLAVINGRSYIIRRWDTSGIWISTTPTEQRQSLLIRTPEGWKVKDYQVPHRVEFRVVSLNDQIVDLITVRASPELKEAYRDLFIRDVRSEPSSPILRLEEIPGRLPYESGTQLFKRNSHFGQRKLFLVEMLFLKRYSQEDQLVVYAGAAPGNHISYLASLFPRLKFLLVDPRRFNLTQVPGVAVVPIRDLDLTLINRPEQIFTLQELFTNEMADRLRSLGKKVLFLSDIRTREYREEEREPDSADILWNLAQQFNWTRLIQPVAFMLKFRHPFYADDPEKFNASYRTNLKDFQLSQQLGLDFLANYQNRRLTYLEGEIWVQPWAPISSTEVRLVGTDPNKIKDYGTPQIFDNTLFYYNNIYRWVRAHILDQRCLESSTGSPRPIRFLCQDCSLECSIVAEYDPTRVSAIRFEIDRYLHRDLRTHKCRPVDQELLSEVQAAQRART